MITGRCRSTGIYNKILTAIVLAGVFTLFFTSAIHAASLELTSVDPTTLTPDATELHAAVHLSIDAQEGTAYYLRGVFTKKGANNYCGFTWNGSSWFSGPYSTSEGWKQFLKVTVASGSAQTELKAKIDAVDSGCKESGEYEFKVQRFTESGSASFDTQSAVAISFTAPTPTSTVAPTEKPTSTPKPSSTPKPTQILPTSTTKLTQIIQPTTRNISITETRRMIQTVTTSVSSGSAVLAVHTEEPVASTPEQLVAGMTDVQQPKIPLAALLLGVGGVCLLSAAGIGWRIMTKKNAGN